MQEVRTIQTELPTKKVLQIQAKALIPCRYSFGLRFSHTPTYTSKRAHSHNIRHV